MDSYDENKDFVSLEAWKKAREVKLFFYETIMTRLPQEEKFNLKKQIAEATISITANIAEGYGRFHLQESVQFYRIARGSMYELKDHLISCYDLRHIDQSLYEQGLCLIESAKILLNAYIRFVIRQKKSQTP